MADAIRKSDRKKYQPKIVTFLAVSLSKLQKPFRSSAIPQLL